MPAVRPHRPPSLLVATASPARPLPSSSSHAPAPASSSSPFRYVHFPEQHEKPRVLTDPLHAPPVPSPRASLDHPLAAPRLSPVLVTPASPLYPAPPPPPRPRSTPPALPRAPPQALRIPDRLKPWLGIGSWAATSIAFLLAIAFWKDEVFSGLDRLSLYLHSLGYTGHAILFCFIFITTIPPVPLYSTLIVLSGYTFGTWTGAAISYAAALSGALVVFLLARHYLRDSMARLLAHTTALQRAVRAIERRPRLLLLIRVAPYPYNLMNVLLAASHTLSFRTYAACTALSLLKVVVHTSIGASIHSFARFHAGAEAGDGEERGAARAWAAAGGVLCVVIFVYLLRVARRAVDDELEWEEGRPARDEEAAGAAAAAAEMRER